MVMESDWHDDLDVAKAVHTPKGNISIQVKRRIQREPENLGKNVVFDPAL